MGRHRSDGSDGLHRRSRRRARRHRQPEQHNYVRIEGPGIGDPASPCTPLPAGVDAANCIQSNVFSLQGKEATNGGVDVDRAVYSRDATGGTLDVFASSDVRPQSIEVSGTGFDPTRMRGEDGHYVAHIALTSAPPATVKVTNVSGQPAASKSAPVTDLVGVKANFDNDTRILRIQGSSSDTVTPPTLTATGYGALNANGIFNVRKRTGAPASVEVTSSAGGKSTVPVTMSGAPFDAIPVGAFAGANQEVVSGHTVTLDGTGSTGPVKTYSWAQTGGPDVTLSDSTAGQPTFTAADVPADGDATLTFVLTVTGAGGPQSSTVTVHVVSSPSLPTVNAGTPQTVNQNVLVTLDGSLTTGANTYSWKQTGGTPVTLSGATTAKPTFTSPKKGGDLTFTLTATGAGGGAATTDVVVTVRNNTITPTTVIYTQSKRDWRVEGTSNVFGPGVTVTVHNGADLSGPVILTPVNVDVAGNWSVRGTGPAPTATRRISIESSGGGQQLNVPVTVK